MILKRRICASAVPRSARASKEAIAPSVGRSRRQVEERGGQQEQEPADHRRGREHRARRLPRQPELPVDAGRGVADRGEHDRQGARDRPGVPAGHPAREEGDADQAEPDTGDAEPADPLVRQEREPDQERADRHRRLRDRRDAGVDVRLAPRDQPEREGRVERAEHERLAPHAPEVGERPCRPEREQEIGQERDGRDQRPQGHQRRGIEPALDADLDEVVRGPPEGSQREEQGGIAAHRGRVVGQSTPDGSATAGARRASPVATAVPPSTRARPISAVVVTASSRKTAP